MQLYSDFIEAPIAKFSHDNLDNLEDEEDFKDIEIILSPWDSDKKIHLDIINDLLIKNGFNKIDNLESSTLIYEDMGKLSQLKEDIEFKLEDIFKETFDNECIDGEHLTLKQSPRFSTVGDDMEGVSCISIECHYKKDDDYWSEYLQRVCEKNGLKCTFFEWQDYTYHYNFMIS